MFDLTKFDEYKEDNRREVKKAKGGLPASLWETYSSFANCYGGVIILGVRERADGNWEATGLENEDQLRKNFWDTINNPNKVSVNLLTDNDVKIYEISGGIIMVITVPRAIRDQKPVYINGDIFKGTFRRNWEGDYHCTPSEVRAMLRDQTEQTMDMKILEDWDIADLNQETIVYNKIIKDVKIPFKLVGGIRVDDTPVHKALREALANCLVNTDFYVVRGVVIKKEQDSIIMENPGYVRTGKRQMLKGGISDPRNKALMKMFNMIGIGERAGSGVPDIFSVWEQEGWKEPEIVEQYGPDRTILTLSFEKKVAISSDRVAISSDKGYSEHERKILEYLNQKKEISNADAREIIGLSAAGVRKVLKKMVEKGVLYESGKNRSRRYFLK